MRLITNLALFIRIHYKNILNKELIFVTIKHIKLNYRNICSEQQIENKEISILNQSTANISLYLTNN